jgi:hypothetical protein
MKFKWAAIAAILALTAGCHKTEWQTFSPENGNFSILMPGTPEDKSHTRKTPAGEVTSHLYIFSDEHGTYAVSYLDRPAATTGDAAEKWLDRMRDAEVKSSGGELLASSDLKLGNTWPGREIRVTVKQGDGKHVMRDRIYVVKDRMYQVMAVVPEDEITSADTEKFMDSFTLK